VPSLRLVTLGVGALASPRYAPAGLLLERAGVRVMIDGGPAAAPRGELAAWLVTDEEAELMSGIRELARAMGVRPYAGTFRRKGLIIERRPVVHTNHPTFGYLIRAGGARVVWAPEFLEFPAWAAGSALMFAEAAGWNRPIRFRGGVGGHLYTLAVAEAARRHRVRRLVFAHIGRPTLRAIDRGETPPFGEFGADGRRYIVRGSQRRVSDRTRGCAEPCDRPRSQITKTVSRRGHRRPHRGHGE
jgi:hypothetical protein